MRTFWRELHDVDALYALEGLLPMWFVRLIPNCVIDSLDRVFGH